MEDVGEEYFKILTSRSFFQQSVHDKSKFTMHDCVHDLATFVLGDLGLRLEYNTYYIPWWTRHLSFPKEKIGEYVISLAYYLRTFLPLESNQPFRDAVRLEKLLAKARCLRVLSLSQYPCIAELPNSILESKSLRYLDLSSTSIIDIPDKICTLYNLETLLLSNCENLTRLPSEIRRLIKLRHLDFAGSPIKELPPRICELTDLQTLTRFIVCKEHSRIEELGDLQQLHGEFEICGLENVVDVKKVSVAKLREKKFLTSLGLSWDGESCDGTLKEREKILDLLLPHENLKALRIYGFAGERFPDWMGDQSFGNIVEVQLTECKNCKSLPPLGQLPSLQNLQISGFKSVETIGTEFYSDGSSTTKPFRFLEVLRFEDMAKWEKWLLPKDQVFPSLKELVFYECPELDVRLPDCFPSLTKLLVSHCRQLMPLRGFQSLEELEIFACPKQVIFLQDGWPSRLKKIKISRCESLKLLHCTQSKKEKEILHCKDFQHLTSLESLEIIECKELHRLPEELLTNPFELNIVECPFLESGGWENEEDWPN
ncbi:hypothetical protein UlMin_023688 [Ulmus minor]